MRSNRYSIAQTPRQRSSNRRWSRSSTRRRTSRTWGKRMSDHISGPRALADPIADITDVYAFPSPERPGHLVLVQNTLPFAPATASFSDGLVYRFRLRSVPVVAAESGESPFDVHDAEELVFDCVFSEATSDLRQDGTCTTPNGESVAFVVGDDEGASGYGVRAFAGVRWDPFIM